MLTRWALLTALVLHCGYALAQSDVVPLPRGHSHNDYFRDRPLLDALDHGLCSVEADIYLVDGALLVAHDRKELRPEKTLQALYLDPLRERVKANGGRVFPNGPSVTLLIDIKDDGRTTYARLRDVLHEYKDMLSSFTNDSTQEGAVTVIISGACPQEMILAESPRLAAIDGRPSDLEKQVNRHTHPLISESWLSLFDWKGSGPFPEDQAAKLKALVDKAHDNGQRVRFWGLPLRGSVNDVLYEAGVDLLNTDFPEKLQAFLLEKQAQE